jgi:hypothetical protein
MKPKSIILQSGASLFVFVIYICIVSILMSVLLSTLNRVQSQAESVAMEADLSNMRWELRELWAHRNATGQSFAASEIENTNPLRLLSGRPNNYSGESPETPPGAQSIWYFDTKAKRLVYVFSDGRQARYRLTSTAKLNRASLGAMGGIDLVLD